LLTEGFRAEASEWLKTSSGMVWVVFFENLSQIKDILKDKNLEVSFVYVIKKNRFSTWQKPRIL
jgi:hypothetical protein